MIGIVYMATNIVNRKRYIGVTTRGLQRRRWQHESNALAGSKKVFHKALRKYGIRQFEWTILSECSDEISLLDAEIKAISEMRPEYNMTAGGKGVGGLTHSAATRLKMSDAAKRPSRLVATSKRLGLNWSDPDRRAVMVAKIRANRPRTQPKLLGRKHSVAAVEKIRNAAIEQRDEWMKRRHLGPKASSKPVICLDDEQIYESASAAARAYGVAKSALTELCCGRRGRKTVGGKRFAYVKDALG